VPRAEIAAGIPKEVTVAPRVALVEVIAVAVGSVTVGTAGTGSATQVVPFPVLPEAQTVVTVEVAKS